MKLRVTYEVEATSYKMTPNSDQHGGYLYVSPGVVHSFPQGAMVENVVPEFEPGWYRHKNHGDRPYWLQRGTSHQSLPGDVYYYTHLRLNDHTLTRIGTTKWYEDHDSWVRLKFVDDEGTDA